MKANERLDQQDLFRLRWSVNLCNSCDLKLVESIWMLRKRGRSFPYLSGAGRLIVKDSIMLGAAVVTLADAAKTWFYRSH
jgi:uncharacterized membrane protein YkgB